MGYHTRRLSEGGDGCWLALADKAGLAPLSPAVVLEPPAGAAERASCRGIQQRNRTVGGGNSLQSVHTYHHQEATGMRLLRQRAAELSLSHRRRQRDPTAAVRRDWMPEPLLLLKCTGAIMSSQCTTHKPPSSACMCPSARNAVRLAVSTLVVRVACCCLCFSHPLTPPPSSPLKKEEHRTSRKHVGGGSSFQDYASPHPFPIHFDYSYLICLSSLFPSC
jgi:hypothetical protein